MTFQVRVKCLICREFTDPSKNSEKEANAEALNLLHKKLCAALKLEFSPKFQDWDFADEPFPYCESCGQRLQRLEELMDRLKSIQEEIDGSLVTLSALVITSEKSDADNSDSLVTPKLGQLKEYFKSLQDKHDYFRSLVIQRFDPRVNVEHCEIGNHPNLLDVHLELVPLDFLIKAESPIKDFPDPVVEEEIILSETEYKFESSSDIISGADDEPIGRYEATSSSVSQVPTLNVASIDLGKADESPIIVLHNSNVSKKTPRSKRCILRYDKSSKTGDFNGFPFKELENGSYECGTCGLVSARHKKGLIPTTDNIRQHIQRAHIRSAICVECGQTFKTSQTLYVHDKEVHQAPRFQCGLCGDKFSFKWKLNYHVQKHRRQGEMQRRKQIRKRAIGVGVKKPITKFPKENDRGQKTRTRGTRVCVECGEVFSSFQTLTKHRVTVHQGSDHKFHCSACGVNFRFSSQLKRHREVKHGEPGGSPDP